MESRKALKLKRRAERAQRRGAARMPLLWLVIGAATLCAVGLMWLNRSNALLAQKQRINDQKKEMLSREKQELKKWEDKVNEAGTREFIAAEARTKYGYINEGEIRFVVTNPQVLWGPEGIPEEFQHNDEP